MTQAALKVEIAFISDPYASSPTWTDVTSYVDEVDTQRGRNYELDKTEAGTATVTLRNFDGRFDPTNTSSPYYPYVLPYRPLRVTATYSGTTYNLFRGFIERWPQTWATGGTYGTVTITAVDAMKTLLATQYGQSYAQIIVADAPYEQYSFSTFATNSGTGGGGLSQSSPAATLVTGIVGGTDNVAAQFTGFNNAAGSFNSYATNGTDTLWHNPGSGSFGSVTIEGWAKVTAFPSNGVAPFPVLTVNDGTNSNVFGLIIAPKGGGWGLYGKTGGVGNDHLVDLGQVITTGTVYHLAAVFSAPVSSTSTCTVYVNGSALSTTFTVTSANDMKFRVAGALSTQTSTGETLILDEVAAYQTALSAASILNHYNAGSNPKLVASFPQQDSGARVAAALDSVGWPTGLRRLDTGNSTLLAATSLSGSSALDVVEAAAQDELGVVFIAGDGAVVFKNRAARTSATSAVTFGDNGTTEYPYQGDIEIDFDDERIYNLIQVTQSGSTPALTEVTADSTSQGQYGVRPQNLTPAVSATADLTGMANTLLARYKDPHPRVPKVSLESRSRTANFPQVLGREIGDLVTVNRRPVGASTISINCFIDGVQHKITAESWVTSFMLTPQFPNPTY